MLMEVEIGKTESLCPVCLSKVNAAKVKKGNDIYMVKNYEQHGAFSTIIWRGPPSYERWKRPKTPANPFTYTQVKKGCPYDCGLCKEHRQHT